MPSRKTTYKKRKSSYKRRPSTVAKRKNRLLLPWPVVGFILLAVGVLLVGLTLKSSADTVGFRVNAKVPAPLPAVPAVITSPADGKHFKTKPIIVRGTCPTDNYPGNYVVLYRNNIFSGSVPCGSDNTFQLDTDLFDGANILKAQVYTTADDPGPEGTPLTVYFDSAQATVPGGAETLAIRQFFLKTDFKFKGYLVGQVLSWDMELAGGEPPYAVKVDWGDGESSLYSRRSEGKFTIEHKYKAPGEGPSFIYLIKVSAVDGGHREAFAQFFARVNPFNSPIASGPIDNSKQPPGKSFASLPIDPNVLKIAWPAYVVVSLMALSFWLGEQEEFFLLRKKNAIKKHFS